MTGNALHAEQHSADEHWLRAAIELSRNCPPADSAYSVGAIVVAPDGTKLADGYSREGNDPHIHAEESALAKLHGHNLATVTMYTSMEPCSIRKSRPVPCAQLILAAGIRRVLFALREPPVFVECHGVDDLRAGGAEVIEIAELAALVRDINRQVLG